ncbi:MAG: alpha/beta hydrolase [Pseudomonadota bacterium]
MQHHQFDSAGVRIAYVDTGDISDETTRLDLPPVLLIHGFASNHSVNWIYPGWFDALTKSGRRVIAIDNRGHGASEKLYDPAHYGADIMAEDAARLLDHLDVARAHVMGYSMGARITAFLTMTHADRMASAVFGGLGGAMIHGFDGSDNVAHALEAPSVDVIADQTGRMFRLFAEQTGGDLRALAACMRSGRPPIAPEKVATSGVPILIAVGTKDEVSGPARVLQEALPGSLVLDIPNRDHNRAVGDKVYKQGVLGFYDEVEAAA